MRDMADMKVAIVHDWLVSSGGGERVVKSLHEMFPNAPIYTLVYDKEKAPKWTCECDVRTTYIQNWPGAKSHHKLLLSFMPKAWEALDLSEYDLVISSCSSCSKGVITGPDTLHICYCHTPTRYIWDLYYEYLKGSSPFKRFAMKKLIHNVRIWDFQAAQRVDQFVSNSDFVARRIKKFYRRDAVTIHPSSQLCERHTPQPSGDYYLVVSRFVSYKRVDLAIKACNMLGKKLVVIGSGGEEEKSLKALASDCVTFVEGVSDEELNGYYARAKAFLFPGKEDFGLTPVEAMSFGCPVLAYGEGGALETVVNGRTGLFFDEQSADSLADCILRFEERQATFDKNEIIEHSLRFTPESFKTEMRGLIDSLLNYDGSDDPKTPITSKV